MAYKIRPGIVHVKICGADLLVASRPLWESIPRIRQIPKLWAACWAVMEIDPESKTDRDVITAFSGLINQPAEVVSKRFEKIFRTLSEEGYLIETMETGEGSI